MPNIFCSELAEMLTKSRQVVEEKRISLEREVDLCVNVRVASTTALFPFLITSDVSDRTRVKLIPRIFGMG